jgi:hypothetical protein
VRLEPLYRCTFAPTENWHADLRGDEGVERQGFLLVEGRAEGRLAARLRAANFPRRRTDGTQMPDFRGVLETDDGANILFSWHGYGTAADGGGSRLVGSMAHLSDDERYLWLNQAVCAVAGEVRPRHGGGVDVVLDVSELVWEPLDPAGGQR